MVLNFPCPSDRPGDHVTPLLKQQLHWLSIGQGIVFKILTIAYKCLQGKIPPILSHSSYLTILQDPIFVQVQIALNSTCPEQTVRLHAFQVSAPRLWNDLPVWNDLPGNDLSACPIHQMFLRRLSKFCYSVIILNFCYQYANLFELCVKTCEKVYFV